MPPKKCKPPVPIVTRSRAKAKNIAEKQSPVQAKRIRKDTRICHSTRMPKSKKQGGNAWDIEMYSCDVCNFSTNFQRKLRTHICTPDQHRTHTGHIEGKMYTKTPGLIANAPRAAANRDFIKGYSIPEINPQEETHTIRELRGNLLRKGFVQHDNYVLHAHPIDRPKDWVVADNAQPISNFHLISSNIFNVRLN